MKNVLRLGLPAVILLVFGVFTVDVWVRQGPLGLISIVTREPWGAQLFVDVLLCAFFAGAWIWKDARERGLRAMPYLVALPCVGSLAVLAYVIHRALADGRERGAPAS